MRARGGECGRGRGRKGGGDDAMFGNRCLPAHAQGTTGGGGRSGGWGRGERAGLRLPQPTAQRLPTAAFARGLPAASVPRELLFRPPGMNPPPRFSFCMRDPRFPQGLLVKAFGPSVLFKFASLHQLDDVLP